ncbi:DHH family phosphoesterase [Clostridium omnivorum]|uniref:Cyclic-di-AMP phosphodiesterase n=1 Tax=Clostridium omnivorum TaxID=1604902 RepID=A0ABQ5N5F8_9CLOT|nr:DHH family phosphoesterase [Clostridium sp. E14]GLC30437.1 delta-lactam-biosynthetic de-N-acetylase [Clostridium sp. E14]
MDNKYNDFTTSNRVYMLIIALGILVMFFYGHFIVGFAALALYTVLVVYNIKHSKVKKDEWNRFIEDFSSKLDIATRSTLVNLPFPLVIVGTKGDVAWYNQNFSNMLEGEEILGRSINDTIKDINVRYILDEKKSVFRHVNFKNKYYDIHSSVVDTDDNKGDTEKIILLYFYDTTEQVKLEKSIEDSREVIMLLEVDNLDEVVKTTEEDKRPQLIADIERTINNYAQSINGMLKKYSSSKYVLVAHEITINKEMDKKFDILDTIREINDGNTLAVTISMGVGRGGKTPQENFALATSAKELALGRGGDQVVVKNVEKLSFYGGKTKEVEKRTKVRARVISHALMDLIKGSSKVFIMGHKMPDTDCFGASIGIYSAVRLLNKECYIILEGKNNSNIEYQLNKLKEDPDYDNVFVDGDYCRDIMDENSLLIVVDVHNKSYVQNIDVVKECKKIVIIDHHRRSPDFIEGAVLSYIETYASSTSELVTEMLQYMIENPKIKPIEAEALLAGICVDTKNFYFKTGVRTFEAAGFLRRLGADTIEIKRLFSEDLNTYLKRAEIIKAAKVKNNIAIAICPPEIEDTVLAAQAADELLNITGIQASFVIVKIDNEVFISGRSLGDINVQLMMEALGGGGHMTMAGAKLENVSTEDALDKLQLAIDKNLGEGDK